MIKIVKNQLIISLKDAAFLRGMLFSFFSAMFLVVITWILGHSLPEMFGEALSQISKNGEINLGFIEFESFEQIKNITADGMLSVAYSSPFLLIIIGVLAIELFEKNCQDGYFQLLMSRGVLKTKIYVCRVITTTLVATIIYCFWGMVCFFTSQICFGIQGVKIDIINVLLQFVVTAAIVSFFSMCICIFRKVLSMVVFVILSAIGTPAIMSFIESLLQYEQFRYFWIGTCLTYINVDYLLILMISIMYLLFSVVLGGVVFSKTGMR